MTLMVGSAALAIMFELAVVGGIIYGTLRIATKLMRMTRDIEEIKAELREIRRGV